MMDSQQHGSQQRAAPEQAESGGEEGFRFPEGSLAALQQQLGYQFAHLDILCRALTHRSYLQDEPNGSELLSPRHASVAGTRSTAAHPEDGPPGESLADRTGHNERLEFLGDAVLGLAISDLLFRRYPEQPEGALTHWRSALVNTHSLGRIGQTYHLGRFLHMGRGELLSGGRGKHSLLGNTVEALLGAIYLDGGYPAAYTVIQRLFAEELAACRPGQWEKDYKSMLQEHLQGIGLPLPDYPLISMTGAPHERTFQIACVITSAPDAEPLSREGWGRSKRSAEQAAAKAVFAALCQQACDEPAEANGQPITSIHRLPAEVLAALQPSNGPREEESPLP
ncbi:MAG: ribonuclease III [Magnetococcales bacterium]|nr:ribonuclease III [Magnetococcales bacterium]